MAFEFPSQSELLFDTKWDAEKDLRFINLLLTDMELNPEEKNANIPIISLRRARRGLNQIYDGTFSWDDVCDRYTKLKDRYRTFKSIIKQPGVFWDEPLNIVHANNVVWSRLCEMHDLAKAYYYCGELAFEELKQLFERSDEVEFLEEQSECVHTERVTGEESARLSLRNSRRRLFENARIEGFNFPPPNFPPRRPPPSMLSAFTSYNNNLNEDGGSPNSSDSSSS